MEELVAELTAAFTLAHLGLSSEPRQDHAQYIASWLKVLKADKRAIFTAASKAQQAAQQSWEVLPCVGTVLHVQPLSIRARELSVRIASHKLAIKVGCLPCVFPAGDLNAAQ